MINTKIKKFLGNQKDKIKYSLWIKKNEPSKNELEIQKNKKFDNNPLISIIVPMYNTNKSFFEELVNSLINQTYTNWELCLADGSSRKTEYIEEFLKDNRIKYIYLNENKGISENSNSAINLATGDYFGFLDHDDVLPKFTLYEVVKAINNNLDADFFYSDEDKIIKNKRVDPNFKPDFELDTLLSYNYICHFTVMKKELLEKVGNFRKKYDGAQDYDLILRATKYAKKIVHIRKILYHWRINPNSTAYNSDAKPYAYIAGSYAISDFLKNERN